MVEGSEGLTLRYQGDLLKDLDKLSPAQGDALIDQLIEKARAEADE